MKTPRDKDAELHYKWLFFPRWIKLFVTQFLYCMQSANSVLNSVSQERQCVHQEKVFKRSYCQKLLFTWTSTSVGITFSTCAEVMECSQQIDNSGLQTAPSCRTTLSYRSAINRYKHKFFQSGVPKSRHLCQELIFLPLSSSAHQVPGTWVCREDCDNYSLQPC